MEAALEPRLTQADVRVLSVLPPAGEDMVPRPADQCASLWQVGEALRNTDLHAQKGDEAVGGWPPRET